MNVSEQADDITLMRAYEKQDTNLRILYSKVGCILSLILVPAGVSLDYMVYPDHLWPLFRIRLLCDVLTLGVLGIHFTRFGRMHPRVLALSWAILPQIVISWMIYTTEGVSSPYYAGLNLVILSMGTLLPWTIWETLAMSGITIVMYLAACLLHQGSAFDGAMLFNNLYFMVLTSIIVSTASYVTSRRRFEDFRLRHELAVSYNRLAELDRLKSEFFANVSHELRTPLTLIVSPLENLLASGAELPARTRETLEMVRQNALRLLKLINDILELVRLDEPELRMERKPLDLAGLVEAQVSSIRHLAEAKTLVVDCPGTGLSLVVEANADGMEKAVLNLLMNAIKFTPPGGRITVRCESDGAKAVVEVADTGIGIGEKDLGHIFDRFRQADGSSTRRYGGAGLGLALALDIVERHGGSLSVRSKVGSGTTFRMEFPLAAVAAAEEGPAGAAADPVREIYRLADRMLVEPVAVGGTVGSGEHTVLVVEDEPDMRRFLVSILERSYVVHQAADGETGLAMAMELCPDLILLDLMLPGMDGLEVCGRVKREGPTPAPKIILLTARADDQSKMDALRRGADDFLTKPFSTLEVETRIANLIEAGKLERRLGERNAELEETLDRLQSAEARLVQSEKMSALGQLAAGLLHEINNPLNYTLTALEIARESVDESNADLRETLDDIGEGMGRIRDIVSDLRTFAHPSSVERRDTFSLAEVFGSARRLVAHELDGITVTSDVSSDVLACAEKTQVMHVIMNLLVNSAKAVRPVADRRKSEIKVSAKAEGGRLGVRVWDNGVGIMPDALAKVFDPFYTTRTVGDGVGLGLSICHAIVANHGGSMSAKSQCGEWTEMRFDLPLAGEGS
jgi:signal transduction histidine kinase